MRLSASDSVIIYNMGNYLRWQFVAGPRWLAQTLWNFELALLQFFSVGLMLRTLFAHWHKDAVAYTRRSFTEIFIAFAWNQISRTIGFIIRSAVLISWAIVQTFYLAVGLSLLIAFIAWPFLAIVGISAGVILMLS